MLRIVLREQLALARVPYQPSFTPIPHYSFSWYCESPSEQRVSKWSYFIHPVRVRKMCRTKNVPMMQEKNRTRTTQIHPIRTLQRFPPTTGVPLHLLVLIRVPNDVEQIWIVISTKELVPLQNWVYVIGYAKAHQPWDFIDHLTSNVPVFPPFWQEKMWWDVQKRVVVKQLRLRCRFFIIYHRIHMESLRLFLHPRGRLVLSPLRITVDIYSNWKISKSIF